eukprot:c23281_g1_i1 orf=386-1540(+)
MVLLGEGYYAECSAKQTIDILHRRDEFLESKISGVKSQIADLQAESLFFSNTLNEAAAGIVEIREEYVEPSSSKASLKSVSASATHPHTDGLCLEDMSGEHTSSQLSAEDKEHEHIMAKLTMLEHAEAAAEVQEKDDAEAKRRSKLSNDEKRVNDNKDVISNMLSIPSSVSADRKSKNGAETRKDYKGLSYNGEEVENGNLRSQSIIGRGLLSQEGKMQPDVTESTHESRLLISDLYGKGKDDQSTGVSMEELSAANDSNIGPVIRSPGDLLKFEEWRQRMFEKEHALQLAESMRKGAGLSAECTVNTQPGGNINEMKQLLDEPTSQKKEDSQSSCEPFSAHRAFTGRVVERNSPSLPAGNSSKEVKQSQARPASRFKLKQVRQ